MCDCSKNVRKFCCIMFTLVTPEITLNSPITKMLIKTRSLVEPHIHIWERIWEKGPISNFSRHEI